MLDLDEAKTDAVAKDILGAHQFQNHTPEHRPTRPGASLIPAPKAPIIRSRK